MNGILTQKQARTRREALVASKAGPYKKDRDELSREWRVWESIDIGDEYQPKDSPLWVELSMESNFSIHRDTVDYMVDTSTRKSLVHAYMDKLGATPKSGMTKRQLATEILKANLVP